MFEAGDVIFAFDLCIICGNRLVLSWTDFHGEAECVTCGVPYRLYEYGENGRIPDTVPRYALRGDTVAAIRAYWRETEQNARLGTYMGHPDPAAYNAFTRWLKQSEWAEAFKEEYEDD